jgi:hypothetical protein
VTATFVFHVKFPLFRVAIHVTSSMSC